MALQDLDMEKKRVIITDHLHPYLAEWLISQGFLVDVVPDITNDELAACIHEYHGLALSTKILVTPALIDKAPKLEFIARAGSGMENIDVAYAQSKGIHVVNSPEGNANAVAEHAVGLLLSVVNNIAKADRDIRNGIWQREENRGFELMGRTVGIIGYGHTGRAVASKLRGFGVFVLAHDKYVTGFGDEHVEEVSLEQLQRESDVISFHLPLNAETKHYCNAAFLEKCRKGMWLINTSRGKIVNTPDLLAALDSGKVRGAGLDVFENEQFYALSGTDKEVMEELCRRQNIVLTPHVAGWTVESYLKLSRILAEKLAALGISASL